MKFGKISKEEFNLKSFEKDTGAHAVVIAEIGSSSFESDGRELQLVYKVHRRIKIIDKNAYGLATVRIQLYREGLNEEKVRNLKAISYNLENGDITETKMDSKSIFTDKQDKNWTMKKFTLPAVKEGTIFEYTYTVVSPYFRYLRSWEFQGPYPILWSEYSAAILEYFDYMLIPQGYDTYAVKSKESSRSTFTFRVESQGATGPSQTATATPGVTTYKWAMKDVPAIKNEDYITTLDNYVNKVEFQLSSINWPGRERKPVRNTWSGLMTDLLKDEDYGEQLSNNNGFLGDIVDELTKDTKTNREKAEKIYSWVRDNFTNEDYSGLWIRKSLKSIFNARKGGIAEINLLLVAMLKRAKLEAYPVILSTRDNGYVFSYYPLLNRFNYTIAGLNLGDEFVNLDATDPLLGFGKLPAACYNGEARIVNDVATPLMLSADSLKEQKFTSVMIGKVENGEITGTFQQRPTYFESYDIRQQVKAKNQDEYFKKIQKSYTGDITLENTTIDDLKKLESSVLVKYDFKMGVDEQNLMYLNPLLGEANKRNIFKAAERKFPVEMPAVFDEVYSFNMDVPEGYVVDELPKSSMAKYNGEEGLFQYLIRQEENHIQLRCRVKLSKAGFTPEEYPSLREFFDLVVKKQAEQIVFKKKK
ncbi:DUF3858 domain-containing protein [Chitinophaga sp. MM2321]|uniref:transglutaminase domain-containing protein n=1 Tax=Chitinophaga sp. MM2321 TaxID=3137178 RepID=UPI0032D595E9